LSISVDNDESYEGEDSMDNVTVENGNKSTEPIYFPSNNNNEDLNLNPKPSPRNTQARVLRDTIPDEEFEEDVAGVQSYESTLGAKGRLAYRLRCFYSATRILFLFKIGSGSMASGAAKLLQWTDNTKWENEYVEIERDVRDLSCPDFEIGGRRKISTVQRMRMSYKCLN
jgi:hypothetical protein